MRTGELQIVEEVSERAAPGWAAPTSSYLEDLREWPARAAVVAPMRARGQDARDDRPGLVHRAASSGPAEIAMIEELARRRRPSRSTTRALYSERSYIASRLQQSLLPPHLPDVPGLEIAARFRPAGEAYDVGGDFYDIFETGTGSWAIAIGDVCGKGADAAALTAMARYTIRATAIRAAQRPEHVLSLLNEVLLLRHPSEQFLTVAYANLRITRVGTERDDRQRRPSAPAAASRRRAPGARRRARERCSAWCPSIELHLTANRAAARRHARVLHRRGHRGAHARRDVRHGRPAGPRLPSLRRAATPPRSPSGSSVLAGQPDVDRARDDIALVVVQIPGNGSAAVRQEPALITQEG